MDVKEAVSCEVGCAGVGTRIGFAVNLARVDAVSASLVNSGRTASRIGGMMRYGMENRNEDVA